MGRGLGYQCVLPYAIQEEAPQVQLKTLLLQHCICEYYKSYAFLFFFAVFCYVILFRSNLVETSFQHLYVLNRTSSLKNGRMKNLESIETPKPLNHLVGKIKQKHYGSLKG
jgi:hypothetical protein